MDPDIAKNIDCVQQDKNYCELLTWITDGGLHYAFAQHRNLPNKETFYRARVPAGKVREIIVVGAGIAGLTAAYELAQVGHKVTILEARDRVGGRLQTYRGFDDNIHCEVGAMRLAQHHYLVAHYVSLFGLSTESFRNASPNTYLHMHGHKFRNAEWQAKNKEYCDKLWPGWDANLPKGHNVQGIVDLYDRTFGQVMGELKPESSEAEWQAWVRKWSGWIVEDFLRSDSLQDGQLEKLRPWSEQAIKAYQESTYTPILNREMSGFLRKIVEKWLAYPMFGLLDGMDTLPKAFLGKNDKGWNPDVELQNNILLNTVLEKVDVINRTSGQTGVKAICRNRGTNESMMYEADAIIVTVPLPVLQKLDLPIPEEKKRAMDDFQRYNSTKIILQCKSRFWETDQCAGGFTKTTLPIGQLHYCISEKLNNSGSKRGLLLIYTWKDNAIHFGDMTEEQAIQEAVEHISQIHPEMKTEFERGIVRAWHKDPFTDCAVAALAHTGYVDRLETLMTPTDGLPVYLAGESLSWSKAWVQGAIFSGLMQALCLQANIEEGINLKPLSLVK